VALAELAVFSLCRRNVTVLPEDAVLRRCALSLGPGWGPNPFQLLPRGNRRFAQRPGFGGAKEKRRHSRADGGGGSQTGHAQLLLEYPEPQLRGGSQHVPLLRLCEEDGQQVTGQGPCGLASLPLLCPARELLLGQLLSDPLCAFLSLPELPGALPSPPRSCPALHAFPRLKLGRPGP